MDYFCGWKFLTTCKVSGILERSTKTLISEPSLQGLLICYPFNI